MNTAETPATPGNKLEYPLNWNVIFWNDDSTPMGFVTYLLREIFNHQERGTFGLLMQMHRDGRAVAGTYIRSIAESRMLFATEVAVKAGYPLRITIEKEVRA